METVMRKPFQGVINIIRFNWHFYLIALVLIGALAMANSFLTEDIQWIIPALIILAILSITISLGISYYVYDYSNIYSLDWLQPLNIPEGSRLVNIHAGFDETSHLLAKLYTTSTLQVFDFYDPLKHTEVSIERARKLYTAYPDTKKIETTFIPLAANSADYIFNIFAAHEMRDAAERVIFLKQLHTSIKPEGRVIVLEHLRDLPNFIAYNIGFFHFHSRKEWKRNFADADFTLEHELSLTPFLALFILRKNS
jgi:SAM-dependent methyltransferase